MLLHLRDGVDGVLKSFHVGKSPSLSSAVPASAVGLERVFDCEGVASYGVIVIPRAFSNCSSGSDYETQASGLGFDGFVLKDSVCEGYEVDHHFTVSGRPIASVVKVVESRRYVKSYFQQKGLKDVIPIYYLTLFHIFKDLGDELDEERIVKSATGIRNTIVWKKLYKFQRDGVVGAIDKLERFGGCIIADSVGLGKTFEALAIIKYYELRNDRVLVLCPSVSATTGRSTRPTTVAISSPPTASTTTF